MKNEIPPAVAPARIVPRPRKSRRGLLMVGGGVAVVVLIVAGFFVRRLLAPAAPPPKPPVVVRPKPATPRPATSVATAPVASAASSSSSNQSGPTPSATLNNLAHVPAKAINKAEGVADAQAAGAKATDDIVSSDTATTPAPAVQAPPKPAAPQMTQATTELAPGVSATTQTEATAQASPAFRTFVANLNISGVTSGSAPRAFINGRLIRTGETIDSNLGVIFAGVKNDQLVFKDRSGATVMRRF